MPHISLIILLAGNSTRFGRPKQLEEVGPNQEIICEYAIRDAIEADISHIVLVVNNLIIDKITKCIEAYSSQVVIELCDQDEWLDEMEFNCSKPIYGTGVALLAARSLIFQDFIVLNGDDYYGSSPIQQFVKFPIYNAIFGANAAYKLGDTMSQSGSVNRAICISENSLLTDLIEASFKYDEHNQIINLNTDQIVSPGLLISMNAWLFCREFMKKVFQLFKDYLENDIKEFSIPDIVKQLVNDNYAFEVLYSETKWTGLTYETDLKEVKKFLLNL